MNQGYPQGGLASLLASQGRGEDKVLVHMTPGEVQGLQAIALASGGSLTTNPQTGLPEAGWLKNLIPAIAGFTLNRVFPGLGSTATSALVGAATGLIEGSVKKGLNAGFSAYSGSNISEGLRRAAAAQALATPKTLSAQLGLKEDELLDYGDLTKPLDPKYEDFGVPVIRPTTPMPAVAPPTQPKADTGIWSGIKALMNEKGREAFKSGLEGGYTSPFGKAASKYATTVGLQMAMTPDYEEDDKKSKQLSKPRYYIPGAVNPRYGQGYGEWYFQPGYYSDTYPGYAEGGMVGPGDERFADGGEVMVSPGAVLPQPLSVYTPEFTQDREGLKAYYESLLVPPDTTPRDTSALQSYLDDLRNRLKTPYKSSGPGWEFSALPTPSPGGSTSPVAEGGGGAPNAGSPITQKPEPITPAPETAPPPKEELTPPSSVAPGARPEDLGDLFQKPTDINIEPEKVGDVSVLPVEDLYIPELTPEDLYQPDVNEVLKDTQYPGYLNTEPEKVGDVSVTPIENIIAPELTPEDLYQPDIDQVLKDAAYPDYLNLETAPEATPPEREKVGTITYKEQPVGSDFVELGFINPPSTEKIGDMSRPVVDQILKDFNAQPQEKGIFTKFLDLLEGTGGMTGAAISTFREAVNQYKEGDLDAKKLLEAAAEGAFGEELVAEAKAALTPKEDKKEETPKEVVPPPSKSEGRGSSAIPWTTERNYTLRDLINPVERGGGGQPKVTIEELLLENSFASGGAIPGYAQGGLGSLQQYAVGGKLVNGAGDGMSDDIKANINGTQEARLADGEFVIPADVVSHLGNGSTDAGAKQLYAMMDRIRRARTGRERQAPEVNPRNYMPV